MPRATSGVIFYICNICDKAWTTSKEAEECERKHIDEPAIWRQGDVGTDGQIAHMTKGWVDEPTWTTEPPTEPGYYWVKINRDDLLVFPAYWDNEDDRFATYSGDRLTLDNFIKWYPIPLTPPEVE